MARSRRRVPPWIDSLGAGALRSAIAVPLAAGLWPSLTVAAKISRAFANAPFNRQRLARAQEHIEIAMPWLGPDERLELAIQSYEHLFRLAVEMCFAPRLLSEDSWPEHVDIVGVQSGHGTPRSVEEGLRSILSGRPCIMITGHCGNWEVLGTALALLGFPIHALYRPLDNQALDHWVRNVRERRGLTLVDKFGAADILPGLFATGRPVGFVADQNAGDRGLFVPFFGRLASTYKTIALLAMQFEAPIFCGFTRRVVDEGRWTRSSGFRYRLESFDVIQPEDWKDQPDPIFYITARYRRALEQMVLAAPEQYLWMHRIWKSRPRHERLGRPVPEGLASKIRALPWLSSGEADAIIERSRREARHE